MGAVERRRIAVVPELATFEQRARRAGDQQVGEIAMREHLDQVADLIDLARRITERVQRSRQRGGV
jgi:hypothetical protein